MSPEVNGGETLQKTQVNVKVSLGRNEKHFDFVMD